MDQLSTQFIDLSTIPKLTEALAKAQAEIKPPIKNRHVNFTHNGKTTKYSYADLADVIEAVRLPLSKNGLAVAHQLEYSPAGYGLKTSLLHISGERLTTWYPLPDPMKQQIRAQEFGSALTYARRYSISSIVGIASEEDDDGQGAAPTDPPQGPKASVNQMQDPKVRAAMERIMAADKAKVQAAHDALGGPLGQTKPSETDSKFEPDAGPITLLDQLVDFVEDNAIPHDQMKDIIKKVTGSAKKSSELSAQELESLLKYLKLRKT